MTAAADQVEAVPRCCRKSLGALFVSSLAGGAVLARLAVWAQRAGFSPLVLFPLLAGVAIGVGVYLIARQAKVCSLRASIGASLIAALGFLVFEHLFFYLDYRSGFNAKLASSPTAAMFGDEIKPIGFFDFVQLEATKDTGLLPGWVRWIVDATLTILGSVGCIRLMRRQSVRVGQG